MANQANNAATRATRRKLIDAAGSVFAEIGYEFATVRHIANLAGVSASAVSYHFKGKGGMFDAVIDELADVLLQMQPPPTPPVGSAEDQMRVLIRYVMKRLTATDYAAWTYPLWIRETLRNSQRMRPVFERSIKPYNDRLSALVDQLSGTPLTRTQNLIIVSGIVGQILNFMNETKIAHQIYDGWLSQGKGPDSDMLADHIVNVTLYGIVRPHRRASRNPAARKRLDVPH